MMKRSCYRCGPAPLALSIKAYRTRIAATLFNGAMSPEQAQGIGYLVSVPTLMAHLGHVVSLAHLSYVLATAYHETACTMQPIEEYGKGAGRPYGVPDPETGQTYYGRGFVQLTWRENYAKAATLCFNTHLEQGGVDLVLTPDMAMSPFVATQITLFGMSQGWFTGKRLSDYDRADGTFDYVNARRIINGTDRAEMVAGYARQFEEAGRLALGQRIVRDQVMVGSRGADVTELQLLLGLPHDGVFGGATQEAVKGWQRAHGLQPDGVVGQLTWDALDAEEYGL
ncbi:peptidoglycan-binding protein [Aeromonas rivuli]|uniref:peptidoglycan-binding protein n=1 Tax=Aeromonas rivuli TaxID=648794 RepID=UPI000A06FAB9|nr:peptidoglycan-binding protein [Aeromonas rivuli]